MPKIIYPYIPLISIGLILDFLLYSALINIGIGYFVSNTVSFMFGCGTNVLLLRRFFDEASKHGLFKDIAITLLVNGFVISVLGNLILAAFIFQLKLAPIPAKVGMACIIFPVNYLIRKIFF